MKDIELKLCDIQGRLFELSADAGYDSACFARVFMYSRTAKELDEKYNRMQWAGEEYLLEEITANAGKKLKKSDEIISKNVLFWIVYIYRYCHYYTNDSSAEIYKQANVNTMKRNYMMFHTMAPELAIEDLKEIYQQKNR